MIKALAKTFLERLQQRIDLGRVFGGSSTQEPEKEEQSDAV